MPTDKAATNVRLVLPRDLLSQVFDECDRHDTVETGGKLVGQLSEENGNLVIAVNGVIDSGPSARRSPTSLFQDGDYQAEVFRRIESKHPEIEHLGSWHTHHVNGYPTLSEGDRETYHRTVNHKQHNTNFFYALLVVARNRGGTDLDRYTTKHFVFERGDDTVYEIPMQAIEHVDQALVWPVVSDASPSDSRQRLALEQSIIGESYPNIKPFMKKGSQAISWKGSLTLIDGSVAKVNAVENDGHYHAAIQTPDARLQFVASSFIQRAFGSASAALVNAERELNRALVEVPVTRSSVDLISLFFPWRRR